MTEPNTATDQEALRAWYKKLLDEVVREMIKTGAVTGAAIEAAPIWAAPYEILIAKVWDATQKSKFIWAISGNSAVTDHIAGSMAATPREAARHFALKWQMDADRLLNVAKNQAPAENAGERMEAYTDKLVKYAESLYDFTSRDDVWR